MAAAFFIVMMVMMLVAVTLFIVMMVMVMMVMLFFKLVKFCFKSILSLHCLKQLRTCKLSPRSCNNNCAAILFTKHIYAFCYLCVTKTVGMAKYYASRIFNLVVEKLAEILHIHLTLHSINNSCKSVESRAVRNCALSRLNNVRKLTNARWLDKYSVGLIFVYNLFERL